MGPDYDKYRPLLDEFNLADDKKDEFIDVMWALLDSFVARAHGTDAVQKVVDKQRDKTSETDSDDVKSDEITMISELNNE
ncbi:hypothetical protein JCM17844_17970 [Iodidimonas gelatinilytica]|uniref:Uncharacterized protein n=1 Tax=Iodidimonas gelatinilytica TaxID=1236966 RepID=A0A5A7MQ22_9PROT|nr:hypothetical protein [Iodidimonas gelatinilytica]GEQ98160.1 hypothetical protein JCM17844_17970 [Iodidimonas gelatinilytica]